MTQTSARTANPMTIDLVTDNTVFAYGDGASPTGVFDFIDLQRASDAAYTAAFAQDFVQLTPDLPLNDSTIFPNVLVNMPAGTTRIRSRIRRGSVANRIVNMGDSITFNQFNWIYRYAQANPSKQVLRNAYSGRGLTNYQDGNDIDSHLGEVQALAPQIVIGLIGANDLPNATAADFQNRLTSTWAKIRSLMPKSRIVWCTILPVSESKLGGAYVGFNAKRAAVNAFIRNSVGTAIDDVVDFAADPTVGVDSAADNSSLWNLDGLHPADGAQSYLTAVYTPVVDRQLAVPQSWIDSPYSDEIIDTLVAAAAVAVTTFDPNRKSPFVDISDDHRTVSGIPSNGANSPAMSTTSRNAGVLYAEMTIVKVNGSFGHGIVNNSYDPISADRSRFPQAGVGTWLYGSGRDGQDGTGAAIDTAFDENGGYMGINPISFDGTPHILGIKCDFNARRVQFYIDGTRLGGNYVMPAGPIYLFAGPALNGDSALLNTGQSAFAYQPSNTTAWG